ncbi:pre-peptidase C-terminal domain-containing protein [Chondromyces crocatus]|nr:pre-peptidase C-terminal domain-containing protein [Chondromyces crocatus]
MAWTGWASIAALAFVVGCGGEGPAGPAGPAGEPGPAGPAGPGGNGTDGESVSAVSPNTVYLDRTTQVTISGYGTRWSNAPELDFGPGIQVVQGSTIVASPTAIVTTIRILPDADIFVPRDVTVTEGGTTVTYAEAFTVIPPISEELRYGGTVAQGSIFFALGEIIDRNTPLNPLDDLTVRLGETGSQYALSADEVTTYSFSSLVFIDVTAPAGPSDIIISNGFQEDPNNPPTISRFPGAFPVAARNATALTIGTPATASVSQPLQTHLFSIQTSTDVDTVVSVTANNADALPSLLMLPESGRFADVEELLLYTQVTLPATATPETYYFIYWDNNAETGYNFTVTASEPQDPVSACMNAQVVTLPANITGQSLADQNDQDWFAVEVPADAVGGTLTLATSPGDPQTDTVIQVYLDDCTTVFDESEDLDYHETLTTMSLPSAGTYYVRVFNSDFGFSGSGYNLSITLNPPAPGDANEPNDTCATATNAGALPVSQQNLTLPTSADQDWFAIDVPASAIGQRLFAKTSPGDANTDTVIQFFRDDCTTSFGESQDIDYHDHVTSALIADAGTYYVKVSNSTFGHAGAAYDLDVSVVAPRPTETEPNNTSAQANVFASTLPDIAAEISPALDEDWYAIDVQTGETLVLLVDDSETRSCAAGQIDSRLFLYRPDLTSMGSTDNIDTQGGNLCSYAKLTMTASGTYYVRITAGQANPNATFDYTLFAYIL